ncbi:MAG: tetratricopeptide repeat protein, partial [Cyclobacteriaceae bacterium]|nr:tetratricopeptide repeat protein [Cyclobacteriaceae bacterium HetDA_MAG_MS6]
SLQSLLNTNLSDTSKVNTLINLAFELRTIDATATIAMANQAYSLADSISFLKGKAQALRNIAIGYLYHNKSDSAVYYGRLSERLAASINDHRVQGDAFNTIGNAYQIESSYDSAREAHQRSFDLFAIIHNSSGMATALSSIGITYSEQGKHSKALEHYQQAMKIYEENSQIENIANTYNNMANIYMERDEFDKALAYYLKTSKYDSITGNKSGRAHTLLNIGNILINMGRTEEAKDNYQLAISLAQSSGSECSISMPMTQLGDLYLDEQEYDSAYYYISTALSIAKRCDYDRSMASAYLDLGEYYRSKGDLDMAARQLLTGFRVAEKKELKPNMEELSEALFEIYELKKDYASAFTYLKISKALERELFNKENTQKITRLESEYEFEKEKQVIAAEQEKKELAFQQKLTKQRWIQYTALLIMVLLGVIAIISFKSYKRKQADNTLLVEKNENLKALRVRERLLSQEAIAVKERELATMAMSTHEKNSLLQDLEQKVSFLEARLDDGVKNDLKEMRKTIAESYSLDKSWDSFLHRFEDVHPQFFDKLKVENPNLTINDLKLSAYLKIGMSNKEIANVTHLTLGSVKSSINRLKKKLNIEAQGSIRDFVLRYA